MLSWARTCGSVAALLTAHRARVFDLLSAGDIPGVDAEALAFRRLASPLKVPGYDWWPAIWVAMRTLLEGRHDEAEARALAAFELGSDSFPSQAMFNLSFLLFFLRREQGRLVEMEQSTRDVAAEYADIPALRVGLIFLLAELGRTDEAAGLLRSVDDTALARLRDRNWPASWFQLARAAFLVGDRDIAAKLLETQHRPAERCIGVSLATVCLGAADLGLAWLHHCVGDLEAADAAFGSAGLVNASIGARAWLAQTQVDHAHSLVSRGEPEDLSRARALVEGVTPTVRELGLGLLEPTVTELAANLATPDRSTSGSEATFRRTGKVWELGFAGRTARVPHARGLEDLARLLAHPNQQLSVIELLGGGGGAAAVPGPRAPLYSTRAPDARSTPASRNSTPPRPTPRPTGTPKPPRSHARNANN